MPAKRDGQHRIDSGRRELLRAIPVVGAIGIGSRIASAATHGQSIHSETTADGSEATFPDLLELPVGFRPEGIVSGRGTTFYVGSLASGDIYRGDLRTGEGNVLVSAPDGRVAIGLSYDDRSNNVFAAGGGTGKGSVYDAETGEPVSAFDLTEPGTFVNDVVVTSRGAYFTDSFRPFLYRVPLGPGGRLRGQNAVEEIPLGGEFVSVPGFNTNGIDAAPTAEFLIIVNSGSGRLYRVNPDTGHATEIDLGGESVTAGDGILLDGSTLYVVRNRVNLIAVVELEPGADQGEVVGEITDSDFDVPTTVAEFGSSLYAVNARFGIPNPATAGYHVVCVPK